MGKVPEVAIARFRDQASALRHLSATAGDVQRRINDALRHRHELAAHREREARPRFVASGLGGRMVDVTNPEAVAEIDRLIAGADAELVRLRDELAGIDARRSAASQLVCRCRDLLVERGVSRTILEF